MKAPVGAFNQGKAILGTFSVIVKSSQTFAKPSFEALVQVAAGGGAGPDHKLPRHNIPSRRRREERPVAREEGESEVRMVKTFLRSLRQLEYQQWQEF